MAEESAKWTRLLAVYERELAVEGPPARRARLLYAAARILDERLGQRREALRRYDEALRDDPRLLPARRALKRLYRQMGQPEMLARMLTEEAELAGSGLERARCLWQRGQVLEALGLHDEAAHAYQDALDDVPSFLPALYSLEPRLRGAQDWGRLSRLLREAAATTGDPQERASLLRSLGGLLEGPLDDPQAALDAYREAVELAPHDVEALATLEQLARRMERWEDLAAVLDHEAALSEHGPSAATALLEAARVRLERLDDPASARVTLRRALELDGRHRASLELLATLLDPEEEQEELAEVLGAWALAEPDAAERADLLSRQAVLLEARGRHAASILALEATLAAYPLHQAALQALGAHYREHGDYAALCQLQLAEARATEDLDLRAQGLLRAAELLDEELGDPILAVAVLREALETGPGRLAVVRELRRLLARAERWSELADILEREAERSLEPSQAVGHWLELARVREDHLDDPVGAATALRCLLELQADHRGALEALARLCRHLRRWEELVGALLASAELTDDTRAVAATLCEAGRVRGEELGDVEGARELYTRAARVNPAYVPALQALGRLLSAAGDWDELLAMHRRCLDVVEVPGARAGLHKRIGLLLWRRLGQPEAAASEFRAALVEQPNDLTALKSLEELARASGNDEDLADILALQSAAATDASTRAHLLARRGGVLERSPEGRDEAAEAYQQAIQEDPGYLPAYRSLLRLRALAGRWDSVAELLGALLLVEEDPAQRILLLLRLATLQERELGQAAAAVQTRRRALAQDPGHAGVLRALEEGLRMSGEPAALAEVLAARARTLDDPAAAGAYLAESARRTQEAYDAQAQGEREAPAFEALFHELMRKRGWDREGLQRLEGILFERQDPERLEQFYERALPRVADAETRRDVVLRRAELLEDLGRHEEARALYEGAVADSEHDLPALKGLQRVLLLTDDRLALLRALEQEGHMALAGERVVPSLLAAGQSWQSLDEPAQALRVYELALRLHPDGLETLHRLEGLLREQGQLARLAPILVSVLDELTTDPARLEARLRLAADAEGRDDLHVARTHLAAALDADATSLRARHAQARVLERLGELEAAASDWLLVAEHTDVPAPALLEARLALGRLWGVVLGRARRAIEVLEQVLELEPEHAEALETLQQVLAREGRWEQFEDIVERRLRLLPAEEGVALRLEWARLEEEERGDRVKAYRLLQAARAEDPTATEPVRQLGRILWEDEAWDTLRELFLEYADGLGPRDLGRAVPFLVQLGDLYRESYSTVADAVVLYERALEIDPDLQDVRRNLASLYARQAETLEQAVAQHLYILDEDPLALPSLRALFNLFERLRAYDRAFAVGGVLEYLGLLAQEDRVGMEEYRTRSLREARRSLSERERAMVVVEPAEGEPLGSWFKLAGRVVHKVFPCDLKAEGVLRGHRVSPRSQDPVLHHCARLGVSLGAKNFRLYRVPEAAADLRIATADPPALVVSEEALDVWSLAQRRYHLARAVASLRDGLHLVPTLGAARTAAFVVASARLEDGGVEAPDVDEGEVHKVAQALAQAMPRRLRRPVAELARLVCTASVPLTEQIRRVTLSLERAGLFFSGDVAVVLRELAGPPPELEDEDSTLAWLRQERGALELIRWALSDRYAELRRAVGMAVD